MISVLFLFPRSADGEKLDEFIADAFLPSLQKARGLRYVKVSTGDVMSPGGPPPYTKVVEASFESLNDVMAQVESPEAQAGRQHVRDLGALILMYEAIES